LKGKIVRIYDARKFGAKGNGVCLDTKYIQEAVDTCSNQGGGTVLLTAGTFLSGTIHIKENVTLHLEGGAVLMGSNNIEDYDDVRTSAYDESSISEFDKCLIYAEKVHNVGITGLGKIDGQGQFFPCGAEAYNFEDSSMAPCAEPRIRPVMVRFADCENVTVSDITFENGSCFACTFIGCNRIKVRGVKIHNRTNQNADGLHFHYSREVFVRDCKFSCTDDCIAVFGGGENIAVTNCSFSTRWTAFRIGPFSEEKFTNIAVSNCVMKNTYGCPIKIQLVEGGQMENISFDNIVMKDVTGPISLRLAGWLGWTKHREKSLPVGRLRNIRFNNIRANIIENSRPGEHEVPQMAGEYLSCINLTGLPGHCIENVFFSNINITFHGGGTQEHASREIPELPDEYPEYHMFGTLPAYGLYARHVKGLVLNNVRFEVENADQRPALICDDVEDVELSSFSAQCDMQTKSLIRFQNTRQAFIHGCRIIGNALNFISIEGDKSDNITFSSNDIGSAKNIFKTANGANESSIRNI
jgi:hypothetical protein